MARDESFVPWSTNSAPNLWAAMLSGDNERFEKEYYIYEQANQDKAKVKARDVLLKWKRQWNEVGTVYGCDIGELNRHTPFRDRINSTNLCTEIALANKEYEHITQLYQTKCFGSATAIVEDKSLINKIKN